MSNTNVTAAATILNNSGNAASTLTTGTVTTYFQNTNVPGEALLAGATVTMAAETAAVNINLYTPTANPVIPSRAFILCVTAPTYTAGTNPTTTAQLAVGPSTTSSGDVACSSATALVSTGTTLLTAGTGVWVNVTNGSSITATQTNGTTTTVKMKFAFTGSPTDATVKLKIYLFGVSAQPAF